MMTARRRPKHARQPVSGPASNAPVDLAPAYEIYDGLIRYAESRGVVVLHRGWVRTGDEGLAGGFTLRPDDSTWPAQVELFRRKSGSFDDLLQETLTLAHEVGHYHSHRDGHWSALYMSARQEVADRMEAGQECPGEHMDLLARRAVLGEEMRAWETAMDLLEQRGWVSHEPTTTRRFEALDVYGCLLALEPDEYISRCGPPRFRSAPR